MDCFHALPLPEQILIAVLVNTGNKAMAVKSAGFDPKHDVEMFIKSKLRRHDFKNAYNAVYFDPALIHEPAALDMHALERMAVRAFEAEIGNEDQGSAEMIRLLWDILRAEKPNEKLNPHARMCAEGSCVCRAVGGHNLRAARPDRAV